jgi:hypothetical protein
MQDPTLARTLQHKFRGQHRNLKPKIFWSQLRQRWTPGFEDILDYGVNCETMSLTYLQTNAGRECHRKLKNNKTKW